MLVYIVITAVMITMSNISMRLILLLVLAAITAITMIFTSDVLEDYQKDRLTVFVLDDEAVAELGADAVRVAYNAEQSQIAIGNGGLTGTGLFQGTQTSSNPYRTADRLHLLGGGGGARFRGAAILLVLFAVVVLGSGGSQSGPPTSSTVSRGGVMSMFVFQVFQSAGMTMGMMPVTGIPMPFVSYGGRRCSPR